MLSSIRTDEHRARGLTELYLHPSRGVYSRTRVAGVYDSVQLATPNADYKLNTELSVGRTHSWRIFSDFIEITLRHCTGNKPELRVLLDY